MRLHMEKVDQERFMRCALQEASNSFLDGEVPVGCVFVRDGRVIAKGHNLTNILGKVSYDL